MYIDTHVHLDFKEFDKDRDEVIKRAFSGGVQKIINIGCNLERSKATVELAQKYENIFAAVGVHPHDVKKYESGNMNQELWKLAQNNKVIAIGECGLDYYRIEDDPSTSLGASKEIQKEFFKAQIALAQKLNLPLIIHCRDAFQDLLEILHNTKYILHNTRMGVTHCFSGNRKYAAEFLKLGFLISFTGSITYTKPDGELLKVVEEVPIDKMMIETDCPYLAPVPHRGERNEPLYVKYVAQKIAEVKGIKIREIEKITTENAIKLFNLK
ncbi:MAG: TatD family hydrolase [Patescibacteria group bacterium]